MKELFSPMSNLSCVVPDNLWSRPVLPGRTGAGGLLLTLHTNQFIQSGKTIRAFGSVVRAFGSVVRAFGSVVRVFGSIRELLAAS